LNLMERGSDPLAEIDRRLGEIQADLAPGGGRAVPGRTTRRDSRTIADRLGRSASGRSGPLETVLERARVPGAVVPEPRQRTLQDRLLAAIDELIEVYESAAPPAPDPDAAVEPEPVAEREVAVSAGPFASMPELREFERSLSKIPGVRAVHVRGYEGRDRAILDVTLGPEPEAPPAGATQ
jgi:hypothetical protein